MHPATKKKAKHPIPSTPSFEAQKSTSLLHRQSQNQYECDGIFSSQERSHTLINTCVTRAPNTSP